MSSDQTFEIGIYRGGERVGNVRFNVGARAVRGDVKYWTFETELQNHLRKILGPSSGTKRTWVWKNLITLLSQELTMSTGGRFLLRYSVTPSEVGRGEDGLRRQINRTVKEA